jgi:hypothetical protein
MEIHTKNNLTCGFKPNPALIGPHKNKVRFFLIYNPDLKATALAYNMVLHTCIQSVPAVLP